MFDLEQELKNLPEDPGVYIMHDKDDKIIYVGKAKILKNRVRQYFQKKIQTTHLKFLQWCRTWHILNILSQTRNRGACA